MEPRKLPKKIYLSSFYFIRVSEVSADDIQGDRGEWASIQEVGNPCVGIFRIRRDLDLDLKWYILRHEYPHGLTDIEDFLFDNHLEVYDPIRMMAECGEEEDTGDDGPREVEE